MTFQDFLSLTSFYGGWRVERGTTPNKNHKELFYSMVGGGFILISLFINYQYTSKCTCNSLIPRVKYLFGESTIKRVKISAVREVKEYSFILTLTTSDCRQLGRTCWLRNCVCSWRTSCIITEPSYSLTASSSQLPDYRAMFLTFIYNRQVYLY